MYKLTFPSNKVYIGISNNFYKRWSDHISISANNALHNVLYKAIRKYSPENIKWQVIDIAKNYETAHELERRYILHFDSYRNGYNSTLGGDGVAKWTRDSIKLEVKKYKRKIDLKQANPSAYVLLNNYKKIDISFYKDCTCHFISLYKKYNKKWSIDNMHKTVCNYNSLKEISAYNKPLYAALGRLRRSNINAYKKVILSLYV